ncbi:hypothetical protein [Limnoglobus roseus]|uniref:HEAT repeat domain-containing protein n=1 Tax=Limnoglobus roseus TaxID=2598579 RepID=A0A5C1ABX9_9BACT|nr:hypothetical protein [Limnoglobus roseus]QEL15683.1 HEAT repeat domain-containing protein [Limnoglobus roseus]
MSRLCLVLALATVGLPATGAVDKQKNDAALKKGVEFLKQHLNETAHGTGVPALVGLAMLEGDVPKTDPAIVSITRALREGGPGETKTYNLALSVLFLDKHNDPNDVPLIQLLGARLIVGQTNFGGWGYNCFPEVPAAEQARLASALRPTGAGGLHPEAAAILRLGRAGNAASEGGDDNSNTQFGLIGTWVAQRRGVPASPAITAVDTRFLRTQSPTDHGWSYNASTSGASSTPAMTCAGLLGLAVGKANDEARKAGRKLVGEGNPKPKAKEDDDPFYNPPARNEKPKKEEEAEDDPEEDDQPKKKPLTIRDMAIERALQALGRVLKQGSGGASAGTRGGVDDLYFLWSLERVAVAYGLDTIGDVDWYEWGTKSLLATQGADGSWPGGNDGTVVNTAFAVLFLKKSNLVADLTRQINGKIKDPGNGELRGSRGGPLAIAAFGRKIDVNTDGAPDPTSPNVGKVRGLSEADRIANGLLAKQSDTKWDGKLKAVRDGKGGQNTAGLAQAIPLLPDKRMIEARAALADRLTRMTAATLKAMLADRDAELRRAACLAVAMKDEKSLTLDLIDRVTDIDDIVVRATRASLKAMFNKDLGPPTGSNDERKRIALDEWKSWYTREGPKP